MKLCLVTGSSGLIDSEVSGYFHERGFAVHGVDNNQRDAFFGPQGNTRWNEQRLQKALTRFTHHEFARGIPETFSIDQSKHSLFGASKVAGDIMVQEFGRYFGMPTCCLRGGSLTGPNHSGVELHGFLSYLVKCNLKGRDYKIFGYQGKQVRDNIHSADVAGFLYEFYQAPRGGKFTISSAARKIPAPSGRRLNSPKAAPAKNKFQPMWIRRAAATTYATTATFSR